MTPFPTRTSLLFCCLGLLNPAVAEEPEANDPAGQKSDLSFEEFLLTEQGPPAAVHLLSKPTQLRQRPAILMLGTLDPETPPHWSVGLLDEGYLLAAFMVEHPPDPDPERRPKWLYFDQRFAHSYVEGGARAPHDAGRIIDFLIERGDVHPEKIGWMGGSSTAILGLAVATREPRLAAFVGFVGTGAYEQWLETWHTNELWRAESRDLWPETIEQLEFDPIRHVETMFPTAVLMVNGAEDRVVDVSSARAFVDAARPCYEEDPQRLRLVVYEGVGHNLPRDVMRMYAEHWFHLYMHPDLPPPGPDGAPRELEESVRRTRINSADQQDVIGGDEEDES